MADNPTMRNASAAQRLGLALKYFLKRRNPRECRGSRRRKAGTDEAKGNWGAQRQKGQTELR